MSLRTCKRGHLTANKKCACGAKAARATPGDGAFLGAMRHASSEKAPIPRDANGRNALRELRAATRITGLGQGQGAASNRIPRAVPPAGMGMLG